MATRERRKRIEKKEKEITGTERRKITHTEQSYCKLTQSYIPGSASRRVQRMVEDIYGIRHTAVIHRRPPEADRLPWPRRLASPPPQLHSSGSNLPHYSFGPSAPLVTSLARVVADLFSSLPPCGAPDVPPEPNIWD
jgi:hypothetical protein